MIDPVSMGIVVIHHKISNKAVKLVKIFCLKLLKINLNTVLETIVFGICGCILIEPMYSIFVEDIMVSCQNIHTIGKEDF